MSETQHGGPDLGPHTRHDLMRMGAREAREELTDEQFEEWARITDHADDLQQIQDEFGEAQETVIDAAVSHHEDEYAETGTWHGNEITYRLDPEELSQMDSEVLALMDDPETNAGAVENPDQIKDVYAQAFATLWTQFEDTDLTAEDPADVRYWIRHEVVETWGLRDCGLILGEQIVQALEREQELQEAVDKFRGTVGADNGSPPAHNRTWERR
jgi:hypothetical protein